MKPNQTKETIRQLENLGMRKEEIAVKMKRSFSCVVAWSKGTREPHWLTQEQLLKILAERKQFFKKR